MILATNSPNNRIGDYYLNHFVSICQSFFYFYVKIIIVIEMNKKLKLKRSVITILVTIIFIIFSILLFISSYYVYKSSRKFSKYNGNKQYSYVIIKKISKPIAEYNKGKFYFITDNRDKIFVYYIKDNSINKFKINNKIYGLPRKYDNNLRDIVIKDINKELSYDKKININKDNYKNYVTSYYLDNSVLIVHKFNYIVFILLLLFILFLFISFKYLNKYKRKC